MASCSQNVGGGSIAFPAELYRNLALPLERFLTLFHPDAEYCTELFLPCIDFSNLDISQPHILHDAEYCSDRFFSRPCPGNDFSTLYAPLIRDGRMEKFYWAPTRDDRVGVCVGIFKEDNIDVKAIETLVDTFPGQSIDFFGALRSRVYDDLVRDWVKNVSTCTQK
jgi:hypothetical protein